MTHDSLTLLLARHPVRIEIENVELAATLRELGRRYVIEEPSPWLTLRVQVPDQPGRRGAGATVRPDGSGGWAIEAQKARGVLRRDERWVFQGEAADLFSLGQLLYLCLSVLLPDRGVLLLHADAVALDGAAYAILGPSGAGKSTLARWLVERAGARLLAVDRTALWVTTEDGPARVVTIPRFLEGNRETAGIEPGEIELRTFVFPARGSGVVTRRLAALEAHQRLLRSVIMPQGEGQPVARALELAQRALGRVEAVELSWALGRDVAPTLRQTRSTGQ